VSVYGIIEDLDLLDVESLTWNTAPGVQNDPTPALEAPVALDMNDLTEVLMSFVGPNETGVRFSTDTSDALADFINSDTDGIITLLLAPSAEGNQLIVRSREHSAGGTLLEGDAPVPPMVAYWPMDEGEGTLVADVVGGNDGTMVGLDPNTAWIADGGVAFDNVDGHHIEVPHADAIEFGDESLTISLMVRYTNPPQGDADLWVMKGTSFYPAGTGCRYQLYQTGGPEVRFTLDDNVTKTDLKVPNDAFLTGEWVHVVAIRDAANDLLSVYADGILLGTQTDNTGDISNGEPLLIGEFPDAADSAMSGDIKDVRIYNAALTEDEIAAIYPAALIADYSFDVDASDATGNYNGTLEGDAAIVDDAERGAVLGLTADGYVSIPPALANELDNFSFTTWVKYGGTVQWAGLLGMGQATSHSTPYWDFHMRADGVLSFYASLVEVWPGDGTAQTVTGFTIPAEWIHIGFTFTLGTGGAVYVNGVAQTLAPWNSSNDHDVPPSAINAEIITIGRDTFNQGTLTNTLIDDFKFYNVALSEDEVAAIYDAGK
jgi:hypothetical protein